MSIDLDFDRYWTTWFVNKATFTADASGTEDWFTVPHDWLVLMQNLQVQSSSANAEFSGLEHFPYNSLAGGLSLLFLQAIVTDANGNYYYELGNQLREIWLSSGDLVRVRWVDQGDPDGTLTLNASLLCRPVLNNGRSFDHRLDLDLPEIRLS